MEPPVRGDTCADEDEGRAPSSIAYRFEEKPVEERVEIKGRGRTGASPGAPARWFGRATGGNYGFRAGKSLALAMVSPKLSEVGTAVEMDIPVTVHRATVIPVSPCDAENGRLQG